MDGGGGYYGGDSNSNGLATFGGSSYISGAEGCNSISEDSTEDNIMHTNSIIHYSGKYFVQTMMESGYSFMPNFAETAETTGNTGNGYCQITKMKIEMQ